MKCSLGISNFVEEISSLSILPASWETCVSVKKQVRTGHGTIDWFQIGKGVSQGCILSPCLFNLYAEYIVWYAGLGEAQAGIKIDGRNTNNLRYADDTTLMAKGEEELKSLLMKVKEVSEKVGLKLSIQKTKSWHPALSLHGKYMGKQLKQWETLFWGAPKHCSHEIKRCPLEEKLWPT